MQSNIDTNLPLFKTTQLILFHLVFLLINICVDIAAVFPLKKISNSRDKQISLIIFIFLDVIYVGSKWILQK